MHTRARTHTHRTHTGCPSINGTTNEKVILYEKIYRKYKINFFHLTFYFREKSTLKIRLAYVNLASYRLARSKQSAEDCSTCENV